MRPYHFSILRYAHHAAAGEFVNIGVAMWLPEHKQFLFELSDKYGRLSKFFADFDGAGYRQIVRDLQDRLRTLSEEIHSSSSVELQDLLRLVIPDDSSCFGYSALMGGTAADPAQRLQQLFYEFVGRYDGAAPRERRDEAEIMQRIEAFLRRHGLVDRVRAQVEIKGDHFAHKFRIGWQNGTTQVLEPISFDYLSKDQVLEKANTWTGRLINLGAGPSFRMTGVVSAPQRADLRLVFDHAVAMLEAAPGVRKIVREEDLDDGLLPELAADLSGTR